MTKFTKTFKSKRYGFILAQAIKEGEYCEKAGAQFRVSFDVVDKEGREGRAIFIVDMDYEDALQELKHTKTKHAENWVQWALEEMNGGSSDEG